MEEEAQVGRHKCDQLLDTSHSLALEVGRGERKSKGAESQLTMPRNEFECCHPSSHMHHVVVIWLHLNGRRLDPQT